MQLQNLIFFSYVFLTLFKRTLFKCLHLLINSFAYQCLHLLSMVKVFKECGLSIIIECNLKTVNFLDATFDLTNDIYKLYRKAYDNSLYINKNSNQPPCILKQLPVLIEKRLSETLSNENVFNDAAKLYNDA